MQENYGYVLKDCSKVLAINPRSSKAFYRSASALVSLDRLDEALDCCDHCLRHDPDNINVHDLRKKVAKLKAIKAEKQAEQLERVRNKEEEERKLRAAFQVSILDIAVLGNSKQLGFRRGV